MDCLNPGHGGLEVGANYETVNESSLALQSVHYLQSMYYEADHPLMTTRTDDRTMSLQERVDKANDLGADRYISIHFNQFHDPQANGFTVFHYPGSEGGQRLAQSIHDELEGHRIESRGVRASDDTIDDDNTKYLAETAETTMPAVLVEMGFLSNKHDREHLTQDQFLYEHCRRVFEGIKSA